jgi:hypothetical protein
MSNARNIQQLNRGSGQLARPRWTWKGYRPPRSAKARMKIERAWAKHRKELEKTMLRLKLPEPVQPEPESELGVILSWAKANGFDITPWQVEVLKRYYDEQELADAA